MVIVEYDSSNLHKKKKDEENIKKNQSMKLLVGAVIACVVALTVATSQFSTVFVTAFDDAVACSGGSGGGQTVVSGHCYHMSNSLSGWPWIRWTCDNHIAQCIYSTTYNDSNCTVPAASHYNYCGECKARILRTCNGEGLQMSVTYQNCTDDECTSCTPLATLPVDVEDTPDMCYGNPIPELQLGKSVRVHRVRECVTLNHSWWTDDNCGAAGTGKKGGDLIVLNECNNGWKFECLP